ncbi:MAG TPA: glycosyltransferase [Methanocorpusculum sp.]|jgi:hypothetical protein|uniref:glycosyltransferase family 2 protein n=1 Tax=Methanocorpusculum sp. TaxID=2058474 RepID=UPI00299C3F32|nr:glycosyltransferase [Methanocorpusculum sp.]MEA5086235.1 glycosyltransferase [Methanocorpusculum sp.]HJJ34500.1 glycosyltransferase [Methanocorpusculum sp.]
MTPPRISIIVPLYNKVNEVERAIDSIFAQTIQDFELIIVDGGSTDGSLDVIKKYETDPRYHLIHQISKGLPAGRNEGIAAARTDIIAFLDADDSWCPTFLEKIFHLQKKYPNAGLYATAYATSYGDHIRKPRLSGIPSSPWEGLIESYFRSSALAFIYPFAPCCVAIPKSTFEKIGLFNPNLRTGEDAEMWGRIALRLPLAFTSSIGAVYSAVATNKMTDNPKVLIQHPFGEYLATQSQEELKKHPDYENIQLYIQKEELAIALNNLYALDPKQARVNLNRVTHSRFLKQKIGLSLISHLPINIQRRILPFAAKCGARM